MRSGCKHTRKLLSGYIDGVLEASEMNSVKEHLAGCEDCTREHASLSSLINNLGSIHSVKAPDDLLEKIHNRMDKDSVLERIRDFFSFSRVRMPVELAAFATTVLLILLFFHLFPNGEKDITENLADMNSQSIRDEASFPAKAVIENREQQGHLAEYTSPDRTSDELQVPIRLAMTLTARRQTTTVPSQSVSYGGPGEGFDDNDIFPWSSETSAVTEDRLLQPDEIDKKIEDIIRSVGGRLVSTKDNPETGYPARLMIEAPAGNYTRFISRMEDIGELRSPAPHLDEGTMKNTVLIQMDLSLEE